MKLPSLAKDPGQSATPGFGLADQNMRRIRQTVASLAQSAAPVKKPSKKSKSKHVRASGPHPKRKPRRRVRDNRGKR